ncbi:MAG TPA: sensor domain-containing diguanylate cyclase [Gemmatimonadaceae bacterium]|nr:sensor domain-containing diguanylate cyclase [Gemmatimonadaceae bacterium]
MTPPARSKSPTPRRAPRIPSLTEPRSRYRSLADAESLREFARNLGEGIYITTPDGRILDANPAFLEMFGVTSLSDLSALSAYDLFVDPKQRDLLLRLLDRDGRVREFEFQIRRPDGEVRWVLDTSYVVQDFETGERFLHGVLVDITGRKHLEAELIEMSTHDALTGCLNRRYLDQLDIEFKSDPSLRWGCIFVDIDHFKHYNDEHGHQAGDRVLIRMARFLMRHVRAEEAVVRVGGDEFVIILTGADIGRTRRVAERIKLSAPKSAPAAFTLGWAAREAGEPLVKLLDRADCGMLNVRVEARIDEKRTRGSGGFRAMKGQQDED